MQVWALQMERMIRVGAYHLCVVGSHPTQEVVGLDWVQSKFPKFGALAQPGMEANAEGNPYVFD